MYLLSRPALAQGVPVACYSLPASATIEAVMPEVDRWQGPSGDRIQRALLTETDSSLSQIRESSGKSGELARLWTEDSLGVKWALARLALEGTAAALRASVAYRELSGEPGPVIYLIKEQGLGGLTPAGLDIVKGPLTAGEQVVVAWMACDAAWLLQKWARDSRYRNWVWNREATPYWPLSAHQVIEVAARLIDGEWSHLALELRRKASTDWTR